MAIPIGILIIAGVMGYAVFQKKGRLSVDEASSFSSQEECIRTNRNPCIFRMCDYIPQGKTFEEICGQGFRKGWIPVMPSPYYDHTPWQSIDTKSFTILLPPGWTYQPLQGIDSQVGEFTGDGLRLTFDYGWYSDPLVRENDSGFYVFDETIDGQQARLVMGTSKRDVGVHFAALGSSGPEKGNPLKLTITGHDVFGDSEQALAFKIFRTIRFPRSHE